MKAKNILIVDDEEHILELLKYNLESSGYNVEEADTGEKALELLDDKNIDMIILDLMLPGMDGLDVLKIIRSTSNLKNIPVIMLTAKSEEIDKVIGLELGADDYMCKPFGIHELMARIKAVFRRIKDSDKKQQYKDEDLTIEKIMIDNLVINKTTHQVLKNGKKIDMPLKEFELLYLLAKNQGRVFTREYLLEKIWEYEYSGETRTVDVHIRNIRKKIEDDDKNPKYIKTLRGLGYKFVEKENVI